MDAAALPRLQSAFGVLIFLALAWALSENRRQVRPRIVLAALALQVTLAVLLLRVDAVRALFDPVNDVVLALQRSTDAGSAFVFGYLGGGPLPYAETVPGASFVLAFRALPLVLVVSALTSLLVYWRILPLVVRGFARVLERTLGIGGAVGLGAAADVFVGMVEAPLFVRPYLRELTRAELFSLMATGMATIAGTVLVVYATILGPRVPDAAGHLLIASIIAVPAAIAIALTLVPETQPITAGHTLPPRGATSAMDAIAQGTLAGLELVLKIAAMLLVLVALVHLANAALGLLPPVGGGPLSLERVLGWGMAPVAWLMGIPAGQAAQAGALLGVKTVLNEFLAYLRLASLPAGTLDARSQLIMTYALCGFANFGSLGILIGGLTTLVPERRDEIIGLGLKSIVAGTLATCMTGAVVGVVVS